MSHPRLPEGFRLLRYDTLGSTNDEARRLAEAGAAPWTLIWARSQSAGRGRRQRAWVSPPGNLYASLILRPDTGAGTAAQLGFVAALALGDAISSQLPKLEPRYKWPNDVLVAGAKLAGILLESSAAPGGAVDWLVIGMGVNVTSHPPGTAYPATSLAAHGAVPALEALLERIAAALQSWEARWRRDGFGPVRQAWLGRAEGLGGPIGVRLEGESLTGRFVDLDGDGALLIETEAGRRRIAAGEVFPAAA